MKARHKSALRGIAGSMLGVGLLSACYTYQPIEIADLTPELEVRTRVSGAEADRLSEFLGSDDRVIEGTVADLGANSFLLVVPVVSSIERGGRGGGLSQRVEMQKSGVIEVEVKELDRTRTGIVAGVLGVAIGAMVIRQLNQDQGGGENPVPPSPPEDTVFRFPILRWGGS